MSRLTACIARMEQEDVDALVLGRDANIRAVGGRGRLWLAGTRTFTPSCVVVRAPVSVTEPRLTWNPEVLAAMLRDISGFADARHIGVDGMTPAAWELLRTVAPNATIVDGTAMLRALVRVKTDDELDALRFAGDVARDAFALTAAALAPGVTGAELRGGFARAAAARGVTTPAFEAITAPLRGGSTWWPTDDAPDEGAAVPVVLRAGVLAHGWEATLARTFHERDEITPPGWDAAIERCRPGARVADLAVVHGVGRGLEVLDPDDRLEPNMVVAIEVSAGNAVRADVIAIGLAGPEVLTDRR